MKKSIVLFFLISMTISGKAQWNLKTSFSTSTPYGNGIGILNSFCFCSADTGTYSISQYLSPTSGTYHLRGSTFNGGTNWTTISSTSMVSNSWTDIDCKNVRNRNIIYLWTFDGVYKPKVTQDGGLSWAFRGIFGINWDFCPIDENIYYYLDGNTLRKYNYLINQIFPVIVDTFLTHNPRLLFFSDTLNGYIISSDSISSNKHLVYKTTQGGGVWAQVFSDTSKNFNCLLFTSINTGYITGSNGVVIKTTDGGANWQDVSIGLNKNIKLIDFFNDSVGVVAGDSGFVMTTINGGLSWNLENTGFNTNISKIYCFRDSIIYALSGSSVYSRVLVTTSIHNIFDNNEPVIIYPNPITNELNIKTNSNQPAEITLYDITSRKLLQETFTNTTTLNTAALAKCIYIYEVRNKNGVLKQGKVVKE